MEPRETHAERRPGVRYSCWSCGGELTAKDKEPICNACTRQWLGRKPDPRNGLDEMGRIRPW
jgi:hypothetical protein